MQEIYYQHLCLQDPYFAKYFVQSGGVQKTILRTSLSDLLAQRPSTKDRTLSFLLEDNQFQFFQFTIHYQAHRPFSQEDLEHIIAEKQNVIRNKRLKAQFLTSYIDGSFDEKVASPLGQK